MPRNQKLLKLRATRYQPEAIPQCPLGVTPDCDKILVAAPGEIKSHEAAQSGQVTALHILTTQHPVNVIEQND